MTTKIEEVVPPAEGRVPLTTIAVKMFGVLLPSIVASAILGHRFAGHGKRLLALCIDCMVLHSAERLHQNIPSTSAFWGCAWCAF
jgi:hypothetical protein